MIQDGYKQNFQTLLDAADNNDLCLIECTDAKTGQIVNVVCASYVDNDGMINMVPVAKMFDGDPYSELNPPE